MKNNKQQKRANAQLGARTHDPEIKSLITALPTELAGHAYTGNLNLNLVANTRIKISIHATKMKNRKLYKTVANKRIKISIHVTKNYSHFNFLFLNLYSFDQ